MKIDEIPDVAGLETRLILERKVLLAHVEEQLHASDDPEGLALANRLAQIGDWTLADLQGDIDIALLGHELSGLREIDAALRRIVQGNYGTCADCGKPIDFRRLNAQPAVRLCLACKEAFEKRRGIISRPTI